LTVPLDAAAGPEALAAQFHSAHEAAFGHAEQDAPVQVVSLRVSASRAAPAIAMPRQPGAPHPAATTATVRLHLSGTWRDAGLYDRAMLDPGAEFAGPAIVTQADCTILVPDGWRARVDELRNVVMEQG
jgi:N-methylhydantoinase A